MTAEKSQKLGLYDFPDYYEASIELIVGRLVLLCGQLDRLFAHALQQRSNPRISFSKAIEIVRAGNGKTLGQWKNWFRKEAIQIGIQKDWADWVIDWIDVIKPTRDRIVHDTLAQSLAGDLEWKTNQSKSVHIRDHKEFEMSELVSAVNNILKFKRFLLAKPGTYFIKWKLNRADKQ